MHKTTLSKTLLGKLLLNIAIGASITFSGLAIASTFPAKPITIIVPYNAGGTNDIIARSVAAQMALNMDHSVIVENKSGAGGNIGARLVAKSAPDGYTILISSPGILAINQWLYEDPGYDASKDFRPITLAGRLPNVLLVNPDLPVKSVEELTAYAKEHPGKLNMASMGNGTSGHLNGELYKMLAGVSIQHVPYRGSAPALTDLIGGQVQLMFDNLPTALPQIKNGQLRALAVTSAERSKSLPEVPTMAEAGVTGFEATTWFGFAAPGQTSDHILERLNKEIVKALNDPGVKQRLNDLGVEVVGNSTEEFRSYIKEESKKWKEVVDKAGVRVQ
ncbi:tripartite tricarboxylate transporter substrate binding protein [Allopusillimonas soli]|uniref:Tripartite tricarboxylate transporter substrate binding protein n=1 Tax=Allopusillimonas soli TaxID=659016 RepID=A0A853FLE6_9BURK|nr:tripartite tricarboxylate transporter substrate binding protein [Allopusillimonas soli]NYT38726.1 tripartite tricarboxylate transporter substrate binding protein [Allopusillimonas soli]TEA71579.1 tripartite tricarboxylate transporter substrate binding protein [Allopusillimonas soli]